MTDSETIDERPRDVAAERAVLGACMLDADVVGRTLAILSTEDFYRPAHGVVFDVLAAQWETGYPTDVVAVSHALMQRGALERVGGAPYLHTLIADVPTATNAAYYADIVSTQSNLAHLYDASVRIRQLALQAGDQDVSDVQDRARETIEAATANRGSDSDAEGVWMHEYIGRHIASWEYPEPGGIPAPYVDLDDVLGGVKPGQFILVAGRTGMGKSVVGIDWALNAAESGRTVMIQSLEMARGPVSDRIVAALEGIRLTDIRDRTLDATDRQRVEKARGRIEATSMRLYDKFSTTLARIRSQARECQRGTHGLDMLIVDHIGLVQAADPRAQRNEQVAGVARGLKLLAGELGIPVIAMAQLNRGPEQRGDKMPHLADLRESGELEQSADIVMLLHRPDAYERESSRAGEVDLILAKHRTGPVATIPLAHQLHFSRFRDLARG